MLAFVHLHKTAGKTVNWILRRSFGLGHCDVLPWNSNAAMFTAADYRRLVKLYSNITSLSSHSLRAFSDLNEVSPEISYFTFIREPITRAASHYQFTIQHRRRHVSFEEWVGREKNQNYQTRAIAGTDNLGLAIQTLQRKFMFAGLVERFDESLVILRRRYSQSQLNIFYHNKHVAPENDIKKRLLTDPKMRQRLEESNRIDTLLYRFVLEELYPKYRVEYGATLDADVSEFRKLNGPSIDINGALLMQFFKRRLFYRPLLFVHRLVPALPWP